MTYLSDFVTNVENELEVIKCLYCVRQGIINCFLRGRRFARLDCADPKPGAISLKASATQKIPTSKTFASIPSSFRISAPPETRPICKIPTTSSRNRGQKRAASPDPARSPEYRKTPRQVEGTDYVGRNTDSLEENEKGLRIQSAAHMISVLGVDRQAGSACASRSAGGESPRVFGPITRQVLTRQEPPRRA